MGPDIDPWSCFIEFSNFERRLRQRLNAFEIPEGEFKVRFRFSKENVRRIIEMVRGSLERGMNRGCPFSPEQTVCLALEIFGGGHFQRTEGDLTGCTKSTAHQLLYR